MRILLLNGPNLNLLGTRRPEVYGATTLNELVSLCRSRAAFYGHRLDAYQSNHEGGLIDAIHAARDTAEAIVFNPGAYTHTSYAIRDAIEAVELPTVEIHISNIREREPWRRISLIEPVSVYQIFGRGVSGYLAAISHLHHRLAHPPITLAYGTHPDQVGDLRVPEGPGPHPVAVLIHGGVWTERYTRDLMDAAAVDFAARGLATWNVEYRRIPPVGGWRQTMNDVRSATDALFTLGADHRLDLDRITVIGHSAGAQLGYFAARTTQHRPDRFVSLAGMLDLSGLGSRFDRLLARFLGDEIETHLGTVDPIQALPGGVPIVAVHGHQDTVVPPDQSRRFVEVAYAAGDEARLVEIPEADHHGVIEPRTPFWERVVAAFLC